MSLRSLNKIRLCVQLIATSVIELANGRSSSVQPNFSYSPLLGSGCGSNQANRGWDHTVQLKQDEVQVIDLNQMKNMNLGAGVGLDALGQPIIYDNLLAILIQNQNAADAPGQLEVAPADTCGWAAVGEHTVANGGALSAQGILLKVQPDVGGIPVEPEKRDRVALKAVGGPVSARCCLLARRVEAVQAPPAQPMTASAKQRQALREAPAAEAKPAAKPAAKTEPKIEAKA